MLHEEVKKYRELSGDTNPNTPISRIGGYLDGYEKALEQEPKTDVLDKIRDEIRKHCERYMDGDIIADEVIQAVENICKAESEEV